MKRTSTGRPRTARTPENVESVRRSVIESPRRSTRRRASILGLSRRLLQRILHGELNFHPYKIMIVQKLLPSDFVQRRLFCERMLEIIASDDVNARDKFVASVWCNSPLAITPQVTSPPSGCFYHVT